MLDLSGCNHELCNRASGADLSPDEIEQIILCGVNKGIFEVVGYNEGDGTFNYRLTSEYKETK